MDIDLKFYIENTILQGKKNNTKANWQLISGGSINKTYKLTLNKESYFVKINTTAIFKNGFKEEVLGLQFLEQNSATVPQIILEQTYNNYCFLVLEFIELGFKNTTFWENFAKHLAKTHKNTNKKFGLSYSNYMGQLTQKNSWKNTFEVFFIENRVQPQVELAFNNKLLTKNHKKQFEKFYKAASQLFPAEQPSAIHGDLWSGNFIASKNQKAVLIDPAVSYSHRETDLAMSMLFGGFSSRFYTIYNEIFPLEKGFNKRVDYYNLYPLLIHLNLFGVGYLPSIKAILKKF